ncbi:UNVERIFIED_CONTAM: hypothetical protein HDU68_011231 [Siphonaria sp. JEL0065]|nr:hypothetical protein HDU68_011231 [Siphonaria sp. JEL0065]
MEEKLVLLDGSVDHFRDQLPDGVVLLQDPETLLCTLGGKLPNALDPGAMAAKTTLIAANDLVYQFKAGKLYADKPLGVAATAEMEQDLRRTTLQNIDVDQLIFFTTLQPLLPIFNGSSSLARAKADALSRHKPEVAQALVEYFDVENITIANFMEFLQLSPSTVANAAFLIDVGVVMQVAARVVDEDIPTEELSDFLNGFLVTKSR